MAQEECKEEQGCQGQRRVNVTNFQRRMSWIMYGDDNAAGEGCEFMPIKNMPQEAMGYFENRKDNTYIKVTSDAIILNEFDKIDNDDLSQNPRGKQTVIETIAGEYFNILPQSIKESHVFGDGCGFTYDSENDAWRYDEKIYKEERKKDKNEARKTGYPWTRINLNLKQDAPYVIVIGDTGVGKSSLLKLLTNYNGIKTSSGDESCTRSTSFYALLSKNICFVDTRGTEDSDTSVTDQQTLNEIQRKMHRFHGSLCKIIWIVHPASRKNKHLEQQVSFISKLGQTVNEIDDNKENKENKDNNEKVNIWDSVMIIVCRPNQDTILTEEIQGVISKTKEKGCSKDHWKIGKNLFGFTNLDWMDKDRGNVKKMIKRLKQEKENDGQSDSDGYGGTGSKRDKEKAHHGNALHYYYNKEIKSFIYDSLLNNKIIKPFMLLSLNYKCIKCGIVGNPKFVNDLKCHSKAQRYHPCQAIKNNINNAGELEIVDAIKYTHVQSNNERKHSGKLESYHDKALRIKVHSIGAQIQHRHPMEPVLSRGGKWAIGIAALSGAVMGGSAALAAAGAVATTAAATTATTAAAEVAVTEVSGAVVASGVVGNISGATAVVAGRNAIGRGLTHLGYESCGTYPCCGGNMVSQGCKKEYSCCHKQMGDQGCQTLNPNDRRYECCGKDVNDPGCKIRYDCCGKPPKSVGCRKVCGDCKEFINSKACSYEMQCCGIKGLLKNKNDEEDGCLIKCQNCQKPWGQPISVNDEYWQDTEDSGAPSEPQGCCKWHSHEMRKIDRVVFVANAHTNK